MLIRFITVGKVRDPHLAALCGEMLKRIRFDAKVEIREIKDSGRNTDNRRICDMLARERGFIIALSEEGRCLGSVEFAEKIGSVHRKLVFVVGGPLGIDAAVKSRADLVLSLSPMTFTHEMARYLLYEQVFRAITINKGRSYHNA
ncbi:MAG: 23S rRNA (pseudouridine(1915)-N(3))-methyltransferase RlmH [Kiritimatiellia bacterium]